MKGYLAGDNVQVIVVEEGSGVENPIGVADSVVVDKGNQVAGAIPGAEIAGGAKSSLGTEPIGATKRRCDVLGFTGCGVILDYQDA